MAAAVMMSVAGSVFACGPFFPNNLLDDGDHAVFQPPVASFAHELERLKLADTRWHAVPLAAGQHYEEQTGDAELADLTAALKAKHTPPEQATAIISFHLAQRAKLNDYLTKYHEWEIARPYVVDTNGMTHDIDPTNPPPPFPDIQIAPGLPREFADYFQGAMAWRQGNAYVASSAWENLLELPPAERHFKSTWAAFMLGKQQASETNEYPFDLALKSFEQVRNLAASGFADSIGLATASIGLEAQIYLKRQDYQRAIDLYLEQLAAGDDTAGNSLRECASSLVGDTNIPPAQLVELAKNSHARRVITAYLLSALPYGYGHEEGSDAITNVVSPRNRAWLRAVEAAGVQDVESADQLALAAYQADDLTAAQHWINLARHEPVAQWLQAKLDLRAGRVDDAARILTKLSRRFPAVPEATNATPDFAGSLYVQINVDLDDTIPINRQISGELGVLHLARREYTESLDALLHSGYWMDAAYVAERVLTADELKHYVDSHWPALPAAKTNDSQSANQRWYGEPFDARNQIRYLLARRLAREARYPEARKFYPAIWRESFDRFTTGLHTGAETNLTAQVRAEALFTAAWVARTNGMELLGTELEPDWAIYEGGYELDVMWQTRLTNAPVNQINRADTNEIARAAAHGVEPDKRFHYRYQAADLAWAAAQLLPDNTDETARILCTAGGWLKYRDPQAADRFYKALVRRCRQTAIGARADELHWFPELDEIGNFLSLSARWPDISLTPLLTNAVSRNGAGDVFSLQYPVPGRKYVIHMGDTLTAIAAAAARINSTIDVTNVLNANPDLNPSKMKVGQLIMIPLGETNNVSPP